MDVGEAVWSASNLLCGSCNLSAHKLLEEDSDEGIINNSDSSTPTQINNITTNPTSLHDPTTSENTNTPITIMDEKTAAKLYEQAMSGRFDDADSFPDGETPLPLPNDTTMVASNVSSSHESSSNSSTPERRERTLTDDTSNSTGSVSKHTLGK